MKKILLVVALVLFGGASVAWNAQTNNSISKLQQEAQEQSQSLQQLKEGADIPVNNLNVAPKEQVDTQISTDRLADGAVTTAKVLDGSITSEDLANDVRQSLQGRSGLVTTSQLASGAVTSVKVLDGSISTADIANGAITADKIAAGVISSSATIGDGSVTTAKLADGAVTGGKVEDGTVTDADIATAAAVALSKLAGGTAGQIIVANASGVAAYTSMSGDITISSTGVTALAADSITNADINGAAAIALSKLASGAAGQLVVTDASGAPSYVAMSGDVAITSAGVTSIAADSIVNADINSAAAIALSKLAGGTAGQLIVADASGVPAYVTMSGDVTVSSAGVTSITAGTIVDADINSAAAIGLSKLASGTAGQIIVANASGAPAYVAVSGDVAISSTGVTSIAADSIVNSDINSAAAIALSKLASGTAGQIIVANASGVPTYTTMSGDVSISSAGATTVANGAITAVKLSTAVRTQTVAVQIGDVAGSNGTERPVFVSPGNGTIVGVSFTNASAIAQSDTDYTTLSVERKTATAGTVKSVTTQVTGGAAFAAFAPQRFVTGLTNTTLAAGDTYSFKKVDTGLGASIDEMLVTVDYAVSE